MAGIAGILAAAVVKTAATKMASPAGDWIMRQWRFKKDLEYMRDTLQDIEAVLEDAERQSIEDKSVQLWLERLTRVSYDICDMFDEFEVNATRKSALRTLKGKFGMASKMKRVRGKIENISNAQRNFSFKTSRSSNIQQVIDDARVTNSKVIADILGRDQEKQRLIDLLVEASTSSDFVVLPIYGIGGIGKTTLAHLLFNDTHFKKYEKAWVYVSQTFNKKKIEDDIASQLEKNRCKLTDIQEPDAANKKVLIILDDLWEIGDLKLDDLKRSLKTLGNSGQKVHVIVTTRKADIAQKIQTIKAHKIKALPLEVCWTIIRQIVDFEDRSDKEMLKDIGKEIAGKCGGVALAARALGFMLRYRDFDGWISVKDSALLNNSTPETSSPFDDVLASLKLSYSSMPSYLRLCFTYCAVFPKGHIMAKDDLIYQWAAHGFIKPSDKFPTWQHGENCIKELLEMSFLQHSKSPMTDEQHGKDVTLFTMHDLVHGLARSIMRDDLLDASLELKFVESNCRYVSLADCSKPLDSFTTYPDKIRALRFLTSDKVEHPLFQFSTAKYLRVLDLGECSMKKLPSNIGQLKLLRYLNAPRIQDGIIPSSITKLSKLIYLSLHGSSEVVALPGSIGKMEGLMYLDLSGCEGIKKLPESFENLKSLLHLDLSYCSQPHGIPEALCSLTKLQYLNLSQHPLSAIRPAFQGLPEAIRKLTELRYLNLSRCMITESGIFDDLFDSISTLLNLEHLDLSHLYELETIPDSFCSLRKLHTLNLSACIILDDLPANIDRMDSLKILIVNGCESLQKSTMPINKTVILLPYFEVRAVQGEQSSNLIQLSDVNPPKLDISRLENVKSVEEARRIELKERQSMVDLTLGWTRGKKGFVEDTKLLTELLPPSSLKLFFLKGYNGVSFPTWLTASAIYLPKLTSVTLSDLSQCTTLPPLGQLPNLTGLYLKAIPNITKIDRALCGDGVKAFARLEELSISEMDNLEEWTTAYSDEEGVEYEFMFPNPGVIRIINCPKLRVGPCPPRVKSWSIKNSDGVLSQWEEGAPNTVCPTSSNLDSLTVRNCAAPMHQWKLFPLLGELAELCIHQCNDLSSSPEITRALDSLRILELSNCSGVQELPRWCGDLTYLQKLELGNCSGIQTLPEWLGDLVSLEELIIWWCEGIGSLPESIQQLPNLLSLSQFIGRFRVGHGD